MFNLHESLTHNLLHTAHQVATQTNRRLKERCALSLAEWRVLNVLGDSAKFPQKTVLEQTGMDKVTTSRAIAKLAQAGLVTVRQDDKDHRVRLLSSTSKGRKALLGATEIVAAIDTGLRGALPDGSIRHLQEAAVVVS